MRMYMRCASIFGVPDDNTVIVLYKRGGFNDEETRRKILYNESPDRIADPIEGSVFTMRQAS